MVLVYWRKRKTLIRWDRYSGENRKQMVLVYWQKPKTLIRCYWYSDENQRLIRWYFGTGENRRLSNGISIPEKQTIHIRWQYSYRIVLVYCKNRRVFVSKGNLFDVYSDGIRILAKTEDSHQMVLVYWQNHGLLSNDIDILAETKDSSDGIGITAKPKTLIEWYTSENQTLSSDCIGILAKTEDPH